VLFARLTNVSWEPLWVLWIMRLAEVHNGDDSVNGTFEMKEEILNGRPHGNLLVNFLLEISLMCLIRLIR